jgi:hypothetical protein
VGRVDADDAWRTLERVVVSITRRTISRTVIPRACRASTLLIEAREPALVFRDQS